MRYQYLLILFFLFPAKMFAQVAETDITGLWKGTLYNDSTQQYYQYEVGISEEKGKLSGFSHTWFLLDDKQYYGVKKVTVKRKDGKILIEDDELIANNYPVQPAKGIRQLNVLVLDATDSIMKLTGPFATNRTKKYAPLTGNIHLERKNDYWQSALVPHLQELNLVNNLSFLKDDKLLAQNNVIIATSHPTDIVANNTIVENRKNSKAINTIPLPEIKEDAVVKNDVPKTEDPKNSSNDIVKVATNKSDTIYSIASATMPENTRNKITQPMAVTGEDKKENASTGTSTAPANNTTSSQPVITAAATINKTAVSQPVAASTTNTISGSQAAAGTIANINRTTTAQQGTVTKSNVVINNTAAAEVDKRITLLQQTVSFHSDSLQLSLYDNGEVDGDTVSVLMNGNIIMAKERLSTNAIRKTIYIPQETDSVQLVMYAENLGLIPPNTGLLVVKDGKDIYEIRFSGDLQKNAAIIFRRKK